MSWDYASASHACSHNQVLERYVLDAFDFRTLHYSKDPSLNMRAPINGAAAIQVYLRGVLCLPSDPRYGYSVVPDPIRIQQGYTFSKIQFNKPVRITQPLIEVSYITRQGFCLQCAGTGIVNDWEISTSGGLVHTHGVRKLAQQSLKYVLTSKNPFSPNLVCNLKSYLYHKLSSGSTQDIAASITNALQNYQSIQTAQKSVQTLSPSEVLRDIQNVSVQQDPNNPLLIYVSILVTAYGVKEPIPLNVALQAPTTS